MILVPVIDSFKQFGLYEYRNGMFIKTPRYFPAAFTKGLQISTQVGTISTSRRGDSVTWNSPSVNLSSARRPISFYQYFKSQYRSSTDFTIVYNNTGSTMFKEAPVVKVKLARGSIVQLLRMRKQIYKDSGIYTEFD